MYIKIKFTRENNMKFVEEHMDETIIGKNIVNITIVSFTYKYTQPTWGKNSSFIVTIPTYIQSVKYLV